LKALRSAVRIKRSRRRRGRTPGRRRDPRRASNRSARARRGSRRGGITSPRRTTGRRGFARACADRAPAARPSRGVDGGATRGHDRGVPRTPSCSCGECATCRERERSRRRRDEPAFREEHRHLCRSGTSGSAPTTRTATGRCSTRRPISLRRAQNEPRAVLEGSPERFVLLADPKRAGRHGSAKPWGTVAMLRELEDRAKVARTPSHPSHLTYSDRLRPPEHGATARSGVRCDERQAEGVPQPAARTGEGRGRARARPRFARLPPLAHLVPDRRCARGRGSGHGGDGAREHRDDQAASHAGGHWFDPSHVHRAKRSSAMKLRLSADREKGLGKREFPPAREPYTS
jgi:hypothetical protein